MAELFNIVLVKKKYIFYVPVKKKLIKKIN